MEASGSTESNRNYYDAFSERYEAHRGEQDPGGYHELLDEMDDMMAEVAEMKVRSSGGPKRELQFLQDPDCRKSVRPWACHRFWGSALAWTTAESY